MRYLVKRGYLILSYHRELFKIRLNCPFLNTPLPFMSIFRTSTLYSPMWCVFVYPLWHATCLSARFVGSLITLESVFLCLYCVVGVVLLFAVKVAEISLSLS
jgi:hypothetical protein